MRTTNKQISHVGSERVAAIAIRKTLRSLGVSKSTLIPGDWHRRSAPAAAESHGIGLPSDVISGRAWQSSNAATLDLPSCVSTQTGILPIEHSSAITYVSSCQSNRHLIYISPQVGNLGFSREDLLDRPDLRLRHVHEDDFIVFEQALRHSCKTAEKFSCHYRMYDSQGKVRWFHDEASVVCDESGMPLFIRGVMLDVSDKKRMEAELGEHRYSLERNVEKRTRELMKRIEMLESCNASLCGRLSSAKLENATLKRLLGDGPRGESAA